MCVCINIYIYIYIYIYIFVCVCVCVCVCMYVCMCMEMYVIKGAALLMAEHFCLPQVVCLPFQGTVLYLGTHMLMNVILLV